MPVIILELFIHSVNMDCLIFTSCQERVGRTQQLTRLATEAFLEWMLCFYTVVAF